MKILLTTPQGACLRPAESAWLPQACAELQCHGPARGLHLEENAARADLIVFLESAHYKTVDYLRLLERDPLVRAHAERICTINAEDHPEGALPGCYTSLTASLFEAGLHRIWPVLVMNNPLVYELERAALFSAPPRRLFCFTGAASHPLRTRLLHTFSSPSAAWHVERIDRWYNHGDTERRHFIQIALDSWFGLCPRGYTAYTHRIAEIMALGRVPVIIADDWLPFSFTDERPWYIRIAERDVEHVADILAARQSDAEELGRNARAVWERNCSAETRVVAALGCLSILAAGGAARLNFAALRSRWNSREFLGRVGWTAPQRVALRVEQHVRRWFPTARIPGVTSGMRERNAAVARP